jgi:hypothetical protein
MMFTTPGNVATLSGLILSSGPLTPVFASATTAYTATVPAATTSVTLTPTVTDSHATVTVKGVAVNSGSASGAISLNPGSNPIPVVVTAEDGLTTKTYALTVMRTPVPVAVTTLAASGVTATGAVLNGSINANDGSATASFDYGTSPSYGSHATAPPSPVTGNSTTAISAVVSGLKPGTLYHYRATGVSAGGTVPGNDLTFTTPSNVATLSGLLFKGGTLSPGFNSATIAYTATVPATTTSVTLKPTVSQVNATVTVNGNTVLSGTASAAITLSLGPNTVPVVVTAQDGVTTKTYTVVVTQAAVPVATTNPATNVGPTTATLSGSVNANGGSTTASFDYGTSATYGSNVVATPSPVTGSTATATSAVLNNLKPGTLYHFRAKGVNAMGTGTGGDLTFTTPSNVATLSGLVLTGGTLAPGFNSNTTSYTAAVPATTTSVTLKPTVSQVNATVTVNGNTVASGTASNAITLSPGPNAIPVVVTAQDGATLKTYIVTVVQSEAPTVVTNPPSAITGTAATFNGTINAHGTSTVATFNYGLTAAYGSTVNAVPSPVTGGNTMAVSARPTTLKPATTYHYQIKGVSTAGTSTGADAMFTTPNNVAALSGLVLSSGPLTPGFSSAATGYTATVSNSTTSVTLTPTVSDPHATVTVNGALVTSGSASGPINVNAGGNPLSVVVTAQDGVTTKTYTVTVTRAAVLATMTTLPASGVGTILATLNGTAVANNGNTALSFDYGTSPTYGHNIAAVPATATGTASTSPSATLTGLVPGTLYHFRAKGVNAAGTATGTDMTFTAVNNTATLSALKLSTGALVPAFNTGTTAYAVTVPNATTSLMVTPTITTNSHATVTVNGASVVSGAPSGPINLAPGANVITIAVTAQDTVTVITYTINVTRTTPAPLATTLPATGLATNAATFNGTANAEGTNTAVSFDYGLTTAYGSSAPAIPPTITGSTSTPVTATVGLLQPGTTYHYRINAVNAGGLSCGLDASFTTISNLDTLSNLVLSTGSMDQSFSPGLTTYTQTAAVGTDSLTITPTVTAGSHATVQVNGSSVTSGKASSSIPLSVGANPIPVVVTAQDGSTTQTYTITVNVPHGQGMAPSVAQQPATTPAAAPAPVPVKAQLTGPVANGGTLPGADAAFAWNAGRGVSAYWLSVGSTVRGADLYDGNQGLALSKTVTLPTDGDDVYVTLYSMINGAWLANSYVYVAADTTRALLTSPADQSVLTAAITPFTWNAVPGADEYWLSIGSTAGATDLYDASQGAALSQSVTLPTDGRQLFVTLQTSMNGEWLASSNSFTAFGGTVAAPTANLPAPAPGAVAGPQPGSSVLAGSTDSAPATTPASTVSAAEASAPAQMTSPSDQVPLRGSSITFTWNPGVGVTQYWLSVGTSTVATDLYNAGQGSNQQVTIAVPTDGSPIYVTLSSLIGGRWQSHQYYYQAALP